ncbi:putative RNA-directed DNA polymerase from transposon X-element [Trichonephila clavipes]|nr:putative RNA-directed DNA polymerase from transposon X-element [Trichonephila clavipes]
MYNNLYSSVVSLHCDNFTVTDVWNLDAIGNTDPTEDTKRKHAHSDFLNQFKENLSVLPDGRTLSPINPRAGLFVLSSIISLIGPEAGAVLHHLKIYGFSELFNAGTFLTHPTKRNFTTSGQGDSYTNSKPFQGRILKQEQIWPPITSLLGLLWVLDKDTLNCNLNYSGEGEISKRNILAMKDKIFDLLGILSQRWLKNHGDWSVFVANGVNDINRLVPSQFWRHVPGELNPADLLSRVSSPRLYSDSLWWEGFSWLLELPSNWPIDRLACETSEVEREKKGKLGYVIWLQLKGKYLGMPLSFPIFSQSFVLSRG